jgi:hypothetical protein
MKKSGVFFNITFIIVSIVSCSSSNSNQLSHISNREDNNVILKQSGEVSMRDLQVISRSFENNGFMLEKHTGFGQDISPEFQLLNISSSATSIAIIMDDLDIPFMKSLNHWVIWNIPKMELIPENIPYGSPVTSMGNAIQGKAYGKNRYRGPKQPFFIKSTHNYLFQFYVLDCFLSLDMNATKEDVINAMQGHIIQYGEIMGKYRRK